MTRHSRLRACNSFSNNANSLGDIDLNSWIPIDEPALPAERRALYRRREQAIRLYLAGGTDAQIRSACGMCLVRTYRLLTECCLKQHADGSVFGWRGLLPHTRVKTYERTMPLKLNPWSGGAVGALQWVFESPEDVESKIVCVSGSSASAVS